MICFNFYGVRKVKKKVNKIHFMEYYLETPIEPEQLEKIRIGDIVYITGIIVTARDEAHLNALELYKENKETPVEFKGIGLFHCGPVMQKDDQGEWKVIAAGPTTSARMEMFQDEFIKAFHPGLIIGKGGMGARTAKACKEEKCIYTAFTGGAALLAANRITKVKDVFWLEELGMPECLWVYEVEKFGPLVVTIDTEGNNLTANVNDEVMKNKDEIIKNLVI